MITLLLRSLGCGLGRPSGRVYWIRPVTATGQAPHTETSRRGIWNNVQIVEKKFVSITVCSEIQCNPVKNLFNYSLLNYYVITLLQLFCHCDVSRWSICRLRAIQPVQRNRKFYGTFLFSQIKSRINVYYAHFNFIKRRSNTKWRPTLQPVKILTSVSVSVCLLCSQGSGRGTAHGAVWIHPRDQRWAGRQAGQHRLCAAEGQRQLGVCGLQWESKHDPWPLTLALSC